MTPNRFAELEDRLANAAANELAVVACDGLAATWLGTGAMPAFDPDLATSFDKASTLIGQVLPNWVVELEGTPSSALGNWTCSIRESGLRDDYQVIGLGRASTAPLAMIVALLQVLISQAKGYN